MFKVFIILILFSVSQCSTHTYLSVPFTRTQNQTHSAHNILLDINQYPYLIDVTISQEQDYFLKIQDIISLKSPTGNPDFRKNQNSVYGIIDYIASQNVDTRLPTYRQIYNNLYYYLKNIPSKSAWINLKDIPQLSMNQRRTNLTQGVFAFGPTRKTTALDDLKKYNPLMKEPIVSWKLKQNNKNGQIYLGTFPSDLLNDPSSLSAVQIRSGSDPNWMIEIAFSKITRTIGSVSTFTDLTTIPFKMRLALNEKTLRVPKKLTMSLQNMFAGCGFLMINQLKYFSCSKDQAGNLNNFKLHFAVTNSKHSLQIDLNTLIKQQNNERIIYNIVQGNGDDYHLSEAILKTYIIGVNYQTHTLYYGQKRSDSWLERQNLIAIFIGGNIIVFIVSILIVSLASTLKKPNKKEEQQSGSNQKELPRKARLSRASGYEMAAEDEQSPGQQKQV